MRSGDCWSLFDGNVGIGDASWARPVGNVPSSVAGTGLISAFVEFQHCSARVG